MSYIKKYQVELEKHFVVVNWDQRGAGKSFSLCIPERTMTEQQFENDLDDLIDYIRKRFDNKKIILVAHSWGTVIGLSYIRIHSEKVLAYVGIGQVIHGTEAEKVGYEFTTQKASATNNKIAIKELSSIGNPPFALASRGMAIQRKWLNKFGGNEINISSNNEILNGILFSPEYSLFDGVKFIIGNIYSVTKLYKYIEGIDYTKEDKEFTIPVYFCTGRYDYVTPSKLVESYYNQISAPRKELFWFEKSGHEPHLEEQERFYDIMNQIYEQVK